MPVFENKQENIFQKQAELGELQVINVYLWTELAGVDFV